MAKTASKKTTSKKSTARRSPKKAARTKTAAPRNRAVNPESKYQQALTYARRHRNLQRTDLVTWLRDELEMTEAGSNTYATAALKEVRELREARKAARAG